MATFNALQAPSGAISSRGRVARLLIPRVDSKKDVVIHLPD